MIQGTVQCSNLFGGSRINTMTRHLRSWPHSLQIRAAILSHPSPLPATIINVTRPSDISKGIAFALKCNIHLVIRNMGHDYLGKSTGAGSLAIWTHHLKSIEFLDYESPHYTGKAIKMGAGIQGFQYC